jgi:hypothetical protein
VPQIDPYITDLRDVAERRGPRRAPARHASCVDDATPDPPFQAAASFEGGKLTDCTGEAFLNSVLRVLDGAGDRLGYTHEPVVVPVVKRGQRTFCRYADCWGLPQLRPRNRPVPKRLVHAPKRCTRGPIPLVPSSFVPLRGHSGTLAQPTILALEDGRNGDNDHELNSEI